MEDENKKETSNSNLDEKTIMAMREEIFHHCMKNMRGGYYTYSDYVHCQPYVDKELTKILESQGILSTTPYDNEIIKVESAEITESEEAREELYIDEFEFIDEEKHRKLQVGFWTRLWHRLLDGEHPWW